MHLFSVTHPDSLKNLENPTKHGIVHGHLMFKQIHHVHDNAWNHCAAWHGVSMPLANASSSKVRDAFIACIAQHTGDTLTRPVSCTSDRRFINRNSARLFYKRYRNHSKNQLLSDRCTEIFLFEPKYIHHYSAVRCWSFLFVVDIGGIISTSLLNLVMTSDFACAIHEMSNDIIYLYYKKLKSL